MRPRPQKRRPATPRAGIPSLARRLTPSKRHLGGAAWGLRIGFVLALVAALWLYKPEAPQQGEPTTSPPSSTPSSPQPDSQSQAPAASQRDELPANGTAGEAFPVNRSDARRPIAERPDADQSPAEPPDPAAAAADSDGWRKPLDPELRLTLDRIAAGGPYPYAQDDTVFFNREGRLPEKPLGYYREFTVKTPGAGDRGPRRIVRGAEGEVYYTADHYRSFERLDVLRLRDPPSERRSPADRRPVSERRRE